MLTNRIANALDAPAPADCDDPEVEEIVACLEWLMIWYCRNPSTGIARIIVTRLQQLREFTSTDTDAHTEWSCSRLLQNWEYIAARRRARS